MTASNFQVPPSLQVSKWALIPGFAESLAQEADNKSNFAIKAIAKEMMWGRNCFYCCIAIDIIGVVGIAMSEQQVASTATLGVGLLLTKATHKWVKDVADLFQVTIELSKQNMNNQLKFFYDTSN